MLYNLPNIPRFHLCGPFTYEQAKKFEGRFLVYVVFLNERPIKVGETLNNPWRKNKHSRAKLRNGTPSKQNQRGIKQRLEDKDLRLIIGDRRDDVQVYLYHLLPEDFCDYERKALGVCQNEEYTCSWLKEKEAYLKRYLMEEQGKALLLEEQWPGILAANRENAARYREDLSLCLS